MARAWITDLWVKDATVELADGTTHKIVATGTQLKSIKKLPEQFRTTRFGAGKRWKVAWYDENTRAQRSRSFASKEDAEAFQAELEDDVRMGRYIDPEQRERRFSEAAEAWLDSKRRIKPSTWRRYRRELDNYVLPQWSKVSGGSITRESIDQWVQALMAGTAPYSFSAKAEKREPGEAAASYVKHIAGRTFAGVMRYVNKEGWIGRNPMAAVELPRVQQRDKEKLPSLSYKEVERLAKAAKAHTGRSDDLVLAHLLMYGGPRIGEATALKVQNFDKKGRRIRVEQTWTTDKEGRRVLGPPKTYEKRWVPLPKFLTDEIVDLIEDRGPEDFVFQSSRGGSIDGGNWYNRVWLKIRATVPAASDYSVHDLRHVAATLAIGAGADVKLVQEMLGHADATETLNTYAALWKGKADEVARKIEKRRTKAL